MLNTVDTGITHYFIAEKGGHGPMWRENNTGGELIARGFFIKTPDNRGYVEPNPVVIQINPKLLPEEIEIYERKFASKGTIVDKPSMEGFDGGEFPIEYVRELIENNRSKNSFSDN